MTDINSIRTILIAFAVLLNLSSCNITKRILTKTHKIYEKADFVDWISENDSSSIYWRKVGNGKQKLLLIHGFGAATEMQWEGVVDQLHNDFTMYIPDLLYFGESTSKVETYDPEFITRQLYQSLQKEKLDNVFVAGISFGGLISSIFAHHYPAYTNGLVLIDALSKYSDRTHTDSLAMAYGYSNINQILIPTDGKSLKTLLQISYYKPDKYPSCLLNKPAKLLYESQREEKEKLLSFLSMHDTDLKSANYNFDGPVRIIWGKNDKIIPLSNAYLLHAFYPNSVLSILQNVGHVANMENPEEVARIILNLASEK